MAEPAQNYRSIDIQERSLRQAWRVWAVTLTVVGVWMLFIIAPPILIANGLNDAASAIYSFFSYICHQKSERSFFILGNQFAVCSRCFGVYFGLFFGIAIYPLWRKVDNVEPLPRFWLILSIVPIAVDWSLGVFGIWENTFASRFITGMILGFACAVFIVPALVEIVRNLRKPAR